MFSHHSQTLKVPSSIAGQQELDEDELAERVKQKVHQHAWGIDEVPASFQKHEVACFDTPLLCF